LNVGNRSSFSTKSLPTIEVGASFHVSPDTDLLSNVETVRNTGSVARAVPLVTVRLKLT
jgi:hypothetical protein